MQRLMGRSPWTGCPLGRDARVPLPEAEAGASARARAPAPRSAANGTGLSQAVIPLAPCCRVAGGVCPPVNVASESYTEAGSITRLKEGTIMLYVGFPRILGGMSGVLKLLKGPGLGVPQYNLITRDPGADPVDAVAAILPDFAVARPLD